MTEKKQRIAAVGALALLLLCLIIFILVRKDSSADTIIEGTPTSSTSSIPVVRRSSTTTVPGAAPTTIAEAPTTVAGESPSAPPDTRIIVTPTTAYVQPSHFAQIRPIGTGTVGTARMDRVGATNTFRFRSQTLGAPDHTVLFITVDATGRQTRTELCVALPSGAECAKDVTLGPQVDRKKMVVEIYIPTKTDGPAAFGTFN